MFYARRTFIYDHTDKSSSKDLQSLRFHLILLFDIQQRLSPEQVGDLLPTSKELADMLADLREIERELKTLFKASNPIQVDIQSYSSLVDEVLKKLNRAIPKLGKSGHNMKEFEKFESSNDLDEASRADRHLDFFMAGCKECCDLLGDIKLNDYYKKSLNLLGLTNI